MKRLDYVRDYFSENKTKIIITKEFINVINYISILEFSSKKVDISGHDINLIINGTNITINKMSDGELIIFGLFQNISFH